MNMNLHASNNYYAVIEMSSNERKIVEIIPEHSNPIQVSIKSPKTDAQYSAKDAHTLLENAQPVIVREAGTRSRRASACSQISSTAIHTRTHTYIVHSSTYIPCRCIRIFVAVIVAVILAFH